MRPETENLHADEPREKDGKSSSSSDSRATANKPATAKSETGKGDRATRPESDGASKPELERVPTTKSTPGKEAAKPVPAPSFTSELDKTPTVEENTGERSGEDSGKASDKPSGKTSVKTDDTPRQPREPEVYSRTPVPDPTTSNVPPAQSPPPVPAKSAGSAMGRAEVVDPNDSDSLLPKGSREEFRERWQALQLRFIDDPQSVATDAGKLVEESLEQLRNALDDRKREVDGWTDGNGTIDTERLRNVVRDYRRLFDKVLGH